MTTATANGSKVRGSVHDAKDAAEIILRRTGKPMHVNDLMGRMLSTGVYKPKRKLPKGQERRFSAYYLAADGRFKQVGPNTVTLASAHKKSANAIAKLRRAKAK